MVIENMQQTLELLGNIKDFFFNIEETEKFPDRKCEITEWSGVFL